jgi:hypothetical protein
MIVAGIYSFNGGREIIEAEYKNELEEVKEVIVSVDSEQYKSKISRERTMLDRPLYSPRALNRAFKAEFASRGWAPHREICVYSNDYYTPEYQPQSKVTRAYREMDCVKNDVGVEVQFGKYAFMVYNVAAKMTIFNRLGVIKVGIEIVPIKAFAKEMSTGVSYFEQFVWDLEHRGTADIDIPVLILGVMGTS